MPIVLLSDFKDRMGESVSYISESYTKLVYLSSEVNYRKDLDFDPTLSAARQRPDSEIEVPL